MLHRIRKQVVLILVAALPLGSVLAVPFPAELSLADLNGVNGFTINGVDDFDGHHFLRVKSAGDINADGIPDIGLGFDFATVDGVEIVGRAYVVFGQASFPEVISLGDVNGSNGFVINGIDGHDKAGADIALAGDMNNDGVDDLVVGATGVEFDDFGGGVIVEQGQAYVIYGRTTFPQSIDLEDLDGINGFMLNGTDRRANIGTGTSTAGDLNGDGIDDVLVSGHGVEDWRGAAYVVFGAPIAPPVRELIDLDGSDGYAFRGVELEDSTGLSVSSAGDFNGDGRPDIIIGAPGFIGDPGTAHIVFGDPDFADPVFELSSLDGTNGLTVTPNSGGGDQMGFSVSGAGDVNADGYDDVIIGTYRADAEIQDNVGKAYVLFGGPSFSSPFDVSEFDGSNGFYVEGIFKDDETGYSVSGAGDFNGDGFDDVVISAHQAQWFSGEKGEVYVVFGAAAFEDAEILAKDLNGWNGFTLKGIDVDDRAGTSVAGLEDINLDGYDDIIVGAKGGDPEGCENCTESYVIYGRSTAPISLEISGSCPGDLEIDIAYASRNGTVVLFTAASEGSMIAPPGTCEGIELGLMNPVRTAVLTADVTGALEIEGIAPAPLCGRYAQLVDFNSCTVSDTVQLP